MLKTQGWKVLKNKVLSTQLDAARQRLEMVDNKRDADMLLKGEINAIRGILSTEEIFNDNIKTVE